MLPSISVIIPHLNQPDQLLLCLEALRCQSGSFELSEIIVVDNGSSARPVDVCARFESVVLLDEPEPGPGMARNRGVSAARGDVLAFIDADCIARHDWLATIGRVFATTPDATVLGGDVRVPRGTAAPTEIEAYESIFAYRMDRYIARQAFTGTGNLAARREVILRVGPFRGIEVAEDRDWGQRAGALGYAVRYEAGLVVFHPARCSFRELAQKWDRHIAHDLAAAKLRTAWRLRWLLRALAVAASPAFATREVILSDRVCSAGERWLAFICLVRIRSYRAVRMLRILRGSDSRALTASWNRVDPMWLDDLQQPVDRS